MSQIMDRLQDVALDVAVRIPPLHPIVNRVASNVSAGRAKARPHPFSLWTPSSTTPCAAPGYVTWPGLVDRGYTGRHLPPCGPRQGFTLPPVKEVVEALFLRPLDQAGREQTRRSQHTTALFCFFAQWFTDSFLRTHPSDDRLNTSNHEIDLCEIYGLTEYTAAALRTGAGGRLKVEQPTNRGDFPPRLRADGTTRPGFGGLGLPAGAAALLAAMPERDPAERQRKRDMQQAVEAALAYPAQLPDRVRGFLGNCALNEAELQSRVDHLYATGVDRGSNTILYAAFNTLFLREHNRIADLMTGTDDERFHAARSVMTVLMLKLVVEEYIRHLGGYRIPFKLDRSFAERKPWYRTNRIAIEFVLLYRWHPMIPETLELRDGRSIPACDYRWNNRLLEEIGIETLFDAASRQPAGSMRLRNTPRFMRAAEERGLELSRRHLVQPFNAYREHFGRPRYRTHEELTGDADLAYALKQFYPQVDDVEFFVGLIAEQHPDTSSFGKTLFDMVAADAFSHIYTNPLLAAEVYKCAIGDAGEAIIRDTSCLQDVVARNAVPGAPINAKFRLPPA